MPSPRREELDEGTLARDVALEVLLGQFDGRRLGAASAAIELTPDNFDAEVFKAGKSAFVKFLAPW